MKTLILACLFVVGHVSITPLNAQSDCTAPTFWTVSSFGEINEFQISGDTVISNGKVLDNVPGQSLAFCNNLNGGNYQPTFYTSKNNQAWYYNGTDWTEFDAVANTYLGNAGGYGNQLYFLDNTNIGFPLYSYTNHNFDSIYTNQSLAWTVADVAVDDNNNAWCFLGTYNPTTTDSVYVFSPTGQILHRYAFNMPTASAYGATFVNGVLYLGINGDNYTSKLYKLTINGNTITAGPAISMPYTSAFDMASCNHVTPLTGISALSNSQPVRLFLTLPPTN